MIAHKLARLAVIEQIAPANNHYATALGVRGFALTDTVPCSSFSFMLVSSQLLSVGLSPTPSRKYDATSGAVGQNFNKGA